MYYILVDDKFNECIDIFKVHFAFLHLSEHSKEEISANLFSFKIGYGCYLVS